MKKTKITIISGIPVYCSFDKEVNIAELVPNPLNPNQHGEEQIRFLSKIIKFQGWRNPITVSTRSGFIVAGHGRLAAAKLLNCESVPVDYQDFKNEAEEYAHLISDNRIAELAHRDDSMIREILNKFSDDFDTELLGYDKDSIDNLKDGWESNINVGDIGETNESSQSDIKIKCDHEIKQEVLDAITEAIKPFEGKVTIE